MSITLASSHSPEERRREPRSALSIAVAVRERGRSAITAQLADLSPYGCQLTRMILVHPDAQVWVRLPGLESQSMRLAWSDAGRFGFAFETPLHPAVVARFVPSAEATPAPSAPVAPPATVAAPLQSRREQILCGITGSDRSPLQARKQPSGLGLGGRIIRLVRRRTDHRLERRFADAVPIGTALAIDGQPVELCNVSASGIRVRGALGEAGIGQRLAVEFTGCEPLTGHVVWRNDHEAGIALPERSIDLVAQD